MSGTTPGGNSGEDAQKRDPFSPPPQQPPSWGQGQPGSWEPPGSPAVGGPPPKPVVTAARLMYAGAAIFGLVLVYVLFSGAAIRDSMRESALETDIDLTADEIESAISAFYAFNVAILALGVALWLWMAWANRRGKSWARVVATILGVSSLLFALLALVGIVIFGLILAVATVALAAFALYLLYRPESSEYFRANSRRAY